MALTNQAKPSTSLSNSTKVNIAETWDSNTTTWDTETRTWDEMASTITNTSKELAEPFFSDFPFLRDLPFNTLGGITNITKPV